MYGIYAEAGSDVVNNGQIVIDGNADHSNAILLNGGKLFQDGKLVVGANLGCGNDQIEQNGICYQKLECGQGSQVANDCVCNENTVKQAGICYTKLTCPEHLVQVGNKCVCDNGYVEQDGVCYAPLTCGMGKQIGNECVCNANTIKQDGVSPSALKAKCLE